MHGVELDYPWRGKSSDHVLVESFNGWLRQERLSEGWLMSLADARCKIEQWRCLYNQERPHFALE